MPAHGRPAAEPQWRQLQVFAFDPSLGRGNTNVITLQIPYEPLQPGPVGRLVAVIDPDFEPVDLESTEVAARGSLEPSEADAQFHQQMTYAVAMKTITDFERALGRPITWPTSWAASGDHGDKLRLVPHAEDAGLNAFFVNGEIRYGYSKPMDPSSLPPDQVVYTCLSYDIVSHQTLHALHAALLPGYFENADIGDGMAVLEGHDDIVTILQHFAFPDALRAVVAATHGRLHDLELPGVQPDQGFVRGDRVRPNPLLGIAPQLAAAFGLGDGHGIRDSVFKPADPKALDGLEEAHERGAVLAGAFLDAFFTSYRRRSADLFAIGGTRDGELNPDLAGRLAAEAAKTARHFLEIAIRGLDYCPPDGIEFGDFLRAVVTADAVRVPNDRWRYREALIDAFRDRGLFPRGVHSYSDEGLRWPDVAPGEQPPPACTGLDLWADEKAIRTSLEPWVVEHRAALGLPGRGAVAVEALTPRVTKPVTGDRPEREVLVRLRAGPSGRSRRSTIVLGSDGRLRHVITRPRDGAQRRRRASAAPEPTLSDILPGARSRSSVSPFDRRRLQILAFDPGRGRALGNYLNVTVPMEPLKVGPVGTQLAVVDYDASNGRSYRPLDLDERSIQLAGGLTPSVEDPRFHQQMAYGVAAMTIERFESTLGREIVWPWARPGAGGTYPTQLVLYPHAMQEANAYYSRELRGIAFGYFRARDHPAGNRVIHTCLSHDIVVHETTHAILDSIRKHFLEPTGPDAAAFHEAFADVIALLQHFSIPDALLATIRRTGGTIHRLGMSAETTAGPEGARIQAELESSNPLVDLAQEFGEALGGRGALRSALGTPPNDRSLERTWEAHDRGAILVAAIFDGFFSVYTRATADLFRMARASGTIGGAGDVRPALAERLAREATDAAAQFAEMCIRALDYCPPVDIEFGDFLRAMVTGEADAADDRSDALSALLDGFRSRGIIPRDVRSLSEEALRWPPAELDDDARCELDLSRGPQAMRSNAIALRRFASANAAQLGLTGDLPINVEHLQILPSQRLDQHGGISLQLHAQFTQQRAVPLVPSVAGSPTFKFRGGTTVVFDGDGRARYAIAKPIDDADRLQRQRDFQLDLMMRGAGSAYVDPSVPSIDLAALHRGY